MEWFGQHAFDSFPDIDELTSMVRDYDPNTEFVFVTVDADDRGDPMVLQTGENGVTPRHTHAQYMESQSMSRRKPGCVLRLDHVVDGMEPGWFVYLEREDVNFRVCRAGEDEDGNICRTSEERELHVDFSEGLRVLDVQMAPL